MKRTPWLVIAAFMLGAHRLALAQDALLSGVLPPSTISIYGTLGKQAISAQDEEAILRMLPEPYLEARKQKALVAGATGPLVWWRGERDKNRAANSAKGHCKKNGGESCFVVARNTTVEVSLEDYFVAETDFLDLGSDFERVIRGKADAPITVIGFFSLSCPNCRDFYLKQLPKIFAKYVDTGLVRFVWRDIPRSDIDVKAALGVRCFAPERFFDVVRVVYQKRKQWTKNEGELVKLLAAQGKSAAEIQGCLRDQGARELILSSEYEARTFFHVGQTPTLVINGYIYHGARSTQSYQHILDRILKTRSS